LFSIGGARFGSLKGGAPPFRQLEPSREPGVDKGGSGARGRGQGAARSFDFRGARGFFRGGDR